MYLNRKEEQLCPSWHGSRVSNNDDLCMVIGKLHLLLMRKPIFSRIHFLSYTFMILYCKTFINK